MHALTIFNVRKRLISQILNRHLSFGHRKVNGCLVASTINNDRHCNGGRHNNNNNNNNIIIIDQTDTTAIAANKWWSQRPPSPPPPPPLTSAESTAAKRQRWAHSNSCRCRRYRPRRRRRHNNNNYNKNCYNRLPRRRRPLRPRCRRINNNRRRRRFSLRARRTSCWTWWPQRPRKSDCSTWAAGELTTANPSSSSNCPPYRWTAPVAVLPQLKYEIIIAPCIEY